MKPETKEYLQEMKQVLMWFLVAVFFVGCATWVQLPEKQKIIESSFPAFPRPTAENQRRTAEYLARQETNNIVPPVKTGTLSWWKDPDAPVSYIDYKARLDDPWRLLTNTTGTSIVVTLSGTQGQFRVWYPQNR